jgi:diguanylate cyclase (GGDEF)-like protein
MFMQGKIRNTLLICLIVMTIVPTFFAVGVYYAKAKASIEQQVYNSLETVLDKQVYFIDNWFWQQRQYALILSSSEQICSLEPQTIENYLHSIAYTNPAVQDMGVADKKGNVIAGTKFIQGLTIGDREYFRKAIGGKTWISDVIGNRFSGKPVVVFAAPIYKDHQIEGVFFSAVSIASISRLMQNLNLDEWTESYIVNQQAFLVTELKSKELLISRGAITNSSVGFRINSSAVAEALAGKSGQGKYVNYLGEEVYGVYQPISINKMAVLIEKDAKAVLDKEMQQAFFTALNTGIVITLIFLPIVVWLSRRFAEPLEKLSETAVHIGNGRYGDLVNIQSNKEVNQLARAFNKMSAQIQEMYLQLNKQIRQLEEQREEIQSQNEELTASQDELMALNAKLEQLASIDPLTNVYNRRYLFSEMVTQIEKASQNNLSLSVILFDIDHFKKINDTYGHQVGDQVLVQLTSLINQALGSDDLIARFGGEEFVLLLPNKNISDSEKFAEHLRNMIEKHIFKTAGGDIRITSSFGVTCFTGEHCSACHTTIDYLLNVTDNLLYQAKRAGRNKVIAKLPTCPKKS